MNYQPILSRFPNTGIKVYPSKGGYTAVVAFLAQPDSKQVVFEVGSIVSPTEDEAIKKCVEGITDAYMQIARLYTTKLEMNYAEELTDSVELGMLHITHEGWTFHMPVTSIYFSKPMGVSEGEPAPQFGGMVVATIPSKRVYEFLCDSFPTVGPVNKEFTGTTKYGGEDYNIIGLTVSQLPIDSKNGEIAGKPCTFFFDSMQKA